MHAPEVEADHEAAVAAARAALGEAAFAAAWAAGQAMTPEQAAAEALAAEEPVATGTGVPPATAPGPPTPARQTARPAGLTAREVEVLRLLAQGKTDRQIAGELIISEKTVGRHLEHVYAKLGVASRTAATALALRDRLV
jgi:DNA-binding NarL/FixJ family response regulator